MGIMSDQEADLDERVENAVSIVGAAVEVGTPFALRVRGYAVAEQVCDPPVDRVCLQDSRTS